ncbi:hypothetical protein BT96DRAFT_1005360 [Gymnopus androsaceus JB14]|uniref:Uncharacterized protein n=1 Tax=Gymnopus androsaceus JB14 TaxID=1447944 RepID=A0A6A4GN39_9AGAR|nr:hypothetical protein BT96DRAFT_1005360 [Gymnopus androsaceus JB14]
MPEKSKVRFEISDDEMDQILEEPAVLPRDIVTVNIDNDTDEEEEEEEPKAGNEFLRAITLDHSSMELDKATCAEDLLLPDKDIFMVLNHDVGHMKADDNEKKMLTVVNSTGNGLWSVFPIIHGQDVEVQATLDQGGRRIPWLHKQIPKDIAPIDPTDVISFAILLVYPPLPLLSNF